MVGVPSIAPMSETKPRWFEVKVEGTVRVEGANVALLEATSRELGLAGLRVNEAPREVAMGYRDAPRGSRSLTQSQGPALERVRKLRVSVFFAAWPGDRTSLLALGTLAFFAVVIAALWYGQIVRAHQKLRAHVEGAVGRALAERAK